MAPFCTSHQSLQTFQFQHFQRRFNIFKVSPGPVQQSRERSSNKETHNSFGGPGSTKKRCQAPAATATSRQSRRRASQVTRNQVSRFPFSRRSLLLNPFLQDREWKYIEITKYKSYKSCKSYKNHEICWCTRVTGNARYKDLQSFEARASSPLGCSWANKTIKFCTKPHSKEMQRKGHWSFDCAKVECRGPRCFPYSKN